MEVPDGFLYEYALVRYVPSVERGECINIGLVMLCKRRKWLKGEIEINPDKILALNSRADINGLKVQSMLFERTDVPYKDLPVEEKYRWLAATKSSVIRVSPSHPGLIKVDSGDSRKPIDILEEEFRTLFDSLVR